MSKSGFYEDLLKYWKPTEKIFWINDLINVKTLRRTFVMELSQGKLI